ncbi:MAG: mannose-1-phosphate guanylyltransferase [Candidatus Hydrogenedens sp.]
MDTNNQPNTPTTYQKWAVIMAGGIGERFWPLSTPEHPKQLLQLGSNNILLKDAIERILPIVPQENIWLATSGELKSIFTSLHLLSEGQIIAEPYRKNTAGCLSYIIALLLAGYGDSAKDIVMAVLTADQLIEPIDTFVRTVSCIMDYVAEKKTLGIIGIPPTRPETGFGYIEVGDMLSNDRDVPIYGVKKFHEKPNEQSANEYLNAGNYFWNSGMFFWKVQTFLEEIKEASFVHWDAIMQMSQELQRNDMNKVNTIFQSLPNISIDYALMERSKNIVMVKGNFHWDDLGSWTSLERVMHKDRHGNVIYGSAISLRTTNSILYNDDSLPITIVSAGVENIVIAVAHNVVLVMDKKEAPNLKEVVGEVERYSHQREEKQ